MSEKQIETRRCPGCGGEQEKFNGSWAGCYAGHIQYCPWWSSYESFDGDVPASSAYADANWRKHWKPKAGDWIMSKAVRVVYKYDDSFPVDTACEYTRPAWPDEIKAVQEAQALLSAAPVVPALDSICADPAMAAFIEDRRAALRKALNAPPAFELGRKTEPEVRLELCPVCSNGEKYYCSHPFDHCPECHGTGYQEVKANG